MWAILLVCVVAGSATAQRNESRVVNTKQGPVRGYKQPDTNVFAFYGIPYATAPTGRQKFMPPLAPAQRVDTLEAVRKDIHCMQPFLPYLQENCLVANVYVPDTNKVNMPVMVTVHGGGFQISFGSAEGPIAMVNSTDMVAVTFNYRLGAAGFLCLGTKEVPGNAGMKDQVALLRWVQDNIAYFGGNPNDVTIAGCSAGGASVDLLSVSPMAEGLFHRVIGGSGSNLATFSVQVDPLENAKTFARSLNVSNVDDLGALEEFYKTASYETLFSPRDTIGVRPDFSILFSPCVEVDLGSERFLPDAPFNLIRRQNIPRYPMLYGFTDMDGILRIRQFDSWKSLMNERFSDFMPADLQFSSSEEKEQVATKIKQFYFGNEDVSDSNILSYLQFFTDLMFMYPMLRVVKLHSEFGDNPIYLYEYSFVDENTEYVPHTKERGAHHCTQTSAVLDENTLNSTKQYLEMKEIMRKLFTNFLTIGVPVPQESSLPAWGPANAQRSPHMSLEPGPTVQLLGPVAQRRAEFLDGIYAQYYMPPGPPINNAFHKFSGPYFIIVMLMPPLAPPEWKETLEAVQKNIYCMQTAFPNPREDCLVANVYVRDTNKVNMPVMVTVHGGGFQVLFGSAAESIAMVNSSDMVAVTFNYRLGAAGFLCLGTEEVPGNAGMKDQVALLRWVRDNIAHFGGNPNDVTIEGCSAGGASVDLLSISPMAEGLFHRVIGGSGNGLARFAVQVDPLENARIYARAVNFSSVDNLVALEEFYKTASYETLLSQQDLIGVRQDVSLLFSPCVEVDLGRERFLPDAPYNLLRQKNIRRYPMLYGYTNMDGLLRIEQFDTWKPLMNERFSDFMPGDLEFKSSESKEEVSSKIKQFYFGNEDVSQSNILSFVQFYTDVIFLSPMLRTVKLHVEFGDNPIYLYEYSFVDSNTPYVPHTKDRGANHCAQTIAVVDVNMPNATKEYLEMRKIMREIYKNFVTLGVPVPQGSSLPAWGPANAQRSPHMSLGPGPTVQLLGPAAQRRAQFWDEIYAQYYRIPEPPKNYAFQTILCPYFVIVMLIVNFLR